jgi:hypothetical protein
MPDNKRISLVSFGGRDFARVEHQLTYSNNEGKQLFHRHLSELTRLGPTTDILTALGVNINVVDRRTARLGMVIMITDGEQTDYGPDAPTPKYLADTYSELKIPIYSIFLGIAYNDQVIAFLESFSIPTGGKVILVKNLNDLQNELNRVVSVTQPVRKNTIKVEQVRNLLLKRSDAKENSTLYAIMRIAMITAISVLFGFCISFIFQSRYLTLPFIIGGFISGISAGVILEYFIQSGVYNDFAARLIHDILLSIVLWTLTWLTVLITKTFDRVDFYYSESVLNSLNNDDNLSDIKNINSNDKNGERQARRINTDINGEPK